MSLSANIDAQELSLSWLGGAATTFDLMIQRTELNETVFYVRTFFLDFVSFRKVMLWAESCFKILPSHSLELLKPYLFYLPILFFMSQVIFSALLSQLLINHVCSSLCFLCVLCINDRRLCLWHLIRRVVGTSGTGPLLNPWNVPHCQSKSALEMGRQWVNGATCRYFKVREPAFFKLHRQKLWSTLKTKVFQQPSTLRTGRSYDSCITVFWYPKHTSHTSLLTLLVPYISWWAARILRRCTLATADL